MTQIAQLFKFDLPTPPKTAEKVNLDKTGTTVKPSVENLRLDPEGKLELGSELDPNETLRLSETEDTITNEVANEPYQTASVEVTGELKAGFGWRGGLLNWLILTVDVLSGAQVISKLARGENLEETDKLVMGGYLEMNAQSNDDPISILVGNILNAKGLNFDDGATVTFEFIGTGTDKMRLGKIVIETLAQAPQPRKTPGDYKNIAAMGNTLIYTFDENGNVDFDHKFYNLQAGVTSLNSSNNFPDGAFNVDSISRRGLLYGIFVDDSFKTSTGAITQLLSRGHIEDFFNDHGVNQHKLADATNAGLFLLKLGKAVFGDGPQDGSEPDSMSFIGMARFIQAIDQFNATLPLTAPMFGIAAEGRVTIKAINDGIPMIKFFTAGSSEPFLEISVQELKNFYQQIKGLVEDEIGELLENPIFNPGWVEHKSQDERVEEAFENNATDNPEGWERPYPTPRELNQSEDGSVLPNLYEIDQSGGDVLRETEPVEPGSQEVTPSRTDTNQQNY